MVIEHLQQIGAIDKLIRAKDFRATRTTLAQSIGVSERTIDARLKVLQSLGAPLEIVGRSSSGYRYSGPWSLPKAILLVIRK